MNRQLIDKGANIVGAGDHGISLEVYLFDPDGNEIKVFYELPKSSGQKATSLVAGSQVAWRKRSLPPGGRSSISRVVRDDFDHPLAHPSSQILRLPVFRLRSGHAKGFRPSALPIYDRPARSCPAHLIQPRWTRC